MRTTRATATAVAAAVLVAALGTLAPAAEQTILGRRLVVKNPSASDPSRRKVIATAKEKGGGHALVGAPTLPGSPSGAVLGLIANGGTSTARAWALPQGTASTGESFWRTAGTAGFRYDDPKGDQGPVRGVLIKETPSGALSIKAKLVGKGGPIDVVPPDPGTDGYLVLEIAGGDRYCVQYGPEAASKNDGDRFWKIAKPTAEGCALAGEFLLLNYNVAGLPQGISGSDPAVNMPLIGPLLNGYDLVLVQESWQTPDPNPLPLRVYHEILRAAVDHPYESIPQPQPLGQDPSRPSAILSDGLNRFSRFPMEPVLREAWNGCWETSADCLALKGFSLARTTFAPGVVVDVYNLHMEAGGAVEDEALRDAAVTQVLDFMAIHSDGRAVIVAGDFNLHVEDEPDGTQYQRLIDEGGLTDSCDFLSCAGPLQIEKVLFRNDAEVSLTPLTWSLEDSVFIREDLEPLSDHPALAVRFGWSRVE